MVAAYVSIALACVHIYLGTIGMTAPTTRCGYGYVDASWAKHHHEQWYEDVVAGRAREKFVAAGGGAGPDRADTAPARKQRPA